MDKNNYFIQISGHIPEMRQSEFILGNASDYHFGSGYIRYRGTGQDLNLFLSKLMKDETYFKVIGIFDDTTFNTLKD